MDPQTTESIWKRSAVFVFAICAVACVVLSFLKALTHNDKEEKGVQTQMGNACTMM
jgi:hypothetical protein